MTQRREPRPRACDARPCRRPTSKSRGVGIQGTSVALQEALRYDTHRVTRTDWVSYPILRFKDAPKVHTYVVQRTDQPSTGSGEPPHVPVVPAIANAIYDATGVRMWHQPMTPAYIRGRLSEV
jgi:nicotinate dehydrogenase subunit B